MTQRERELLRERVSASLPPPEEGRVDNLLFQKFQQEAVGYVSGSQEGMDGSTPDPTHPPSRQQSAVGGSGTSSKATHQTLLNYESK